MKIWMNVYDLSQCDPVACSLQFRHSPVSSSHVSDRLLHSQGRHEGKSQNPVWQWSQRRPVAVDRHAHWPLTWSHSCATEPRASHPHAASDTIEKKVSSCHIIWETSDFLNMRLSYICSRRVRSGTSLVHRYHSNGPSHWVYIHRTHLVYCKMVLESLWSYTCKLTTDEMEIHSRQIIFMFLNDEEKSLPHCWMYVQQLQTCYLRTAPLWIRADMLLISPSQTSGSESCGWSSAANPMQRKWRNDSRSLWEQKSWTDSILGIRPIWKHIRIRFWVYWYVDKKGVCCGVLVKA